MEEKVFQQVVNRAEDIFEEGKMAEALECLTSLEPVDQYSEREKALFYDLSSKIYVYTGNYQKAYETAQKSRESAKKIEQSIAIVDSNLSMALILNATGKIPESLNLLKENAGIIKKLSNISNKERMLKLGINRTWEGINYYYLGEIAQSLEHLKNAIDLLEQGGSQASLALAYTFYGSMHTMVGKYNESFKFLTLCQKIVENQESTQFFHPKILNCTGFGVLNGEKGNPQQSLESYKHVLSLARKYNNPSFLFVGLNNLACVYLELGEWVHALKALSEALPVVELSGNISDKQVLLGNFFEVYISMDDVPAAQQIFQEIEEFKDKEEEKGNLRYMQNYRLVKAILMRKSLRTRDLGTAQELFKAIALEEVIQLETTQKAILNLCEMLLDEFRDTKNEDILAELSSFLKPLQDAAEKKHAYPILAETYLLDAQLSIIQFELKQARHSLTQAQQIAERHGLKRLANKISNEHDKLLQNLQIWEQMKSKNVFISERLEKSDINDHISTWLKRKPDKIPETSPESPILLLIMAKSGLPLYTKIFTKEWKIKEGLFSSFLSAFNSFSNEIFSEGLDRANFGKFTILMTGLPPFMSCYVYEGQSFQAQQKFSKFNEDLHGSEQIWKTLTSAEQIGQVINDDVCEGLGQLVQTIF
ncbi:MAG: tetratricopeptide repeat protein [Promethearchaeota archaeon]